MEATGEFPFLDIRRNLFIFISHSRTHDADIYDEFTFKSWIIKSKLVFRILGIIVGH